MDLSTHEFWALIHGLILGGGFLIAFAGALRASTASNRAWSPKPG